MPVLGCSSRGAVGSTQKSDAGGAGALDDDPQCPSADGGGDPDVDVDVDADAGACACSFDPTGQNGLGVLYVPWDCYCRHYDCTQRRPAETDCNAAVHMGRTDYPACGLTVYGASSAFEGPYYSVYDRCGALVGLQAASDDGQLRCPSDLNVPPMGGIFYLRTGRFPDATCAAVACPEGYCGPCNADAGA